MIVILGCIVVMGAVIGGFTIAGGHVAALIHPSELLTIGGAALGAMIVMSPKKVLIDLMKGLIQAVKGQPFDKAGLHRPVQGAVRPVANGAARGLDDPRGPRHQPAPERHLCKYPRIANNHHVTDFICGGLSPIIEGIAKPEQLPAAVGRRAEGDRGRAPRSVGRAAKDRRRAAGLWHRGRRAGNRDHDGRDRRPGRGDRAQGRRGPGRVRFWAF